MATNELQWGWSEAPIDYCNMAFAEEQRGDLDSANGLRQLARDFGDWLDRADDRWFRQFGVPHAPWNVDEARSLAAELGVSVSLDCMSRNDALEVLEIAMRSRADKEKNAKEKWPRNPDVVLFAHFVRHSDAGGDSLSILARQFGAEHGVNGDSLRRQIQRPEYQHLLAGTVFFDPARASHSDR